MKIFVVMNESTGEVLSAWYDGEMAQADAEVLRHAGVLVRSPDRLESELHFGFTVVEVELKGENLERGWKLGGA